MSLRQGIRHGKEHRKPYYGCESFDSSCRPHGGCKVCFDDRMYRVAKLELDAKEQIKEAMRG